VKTHLAIFADPNYRAKAAAPSPTLAQVMYSPANPDRSRKLCENCMMWCSSDENCVIHNPDVVAQADASCSYHVFGPPFAGAHLTPEGMAYVQPEHSGLVQVGGGGRACDRCKFYQPRNGAEGTCLAVRDVAADCDAAVQALACCARWESVDG
jgi:hypothetical protein